MKIYVNRVPLEGLREQATYDPKTLDMERFDIHVEQPVALAAFITRAEHDLIVQADIDCTLQLNCARCLAPFEQPLHANAILSYEVASTDIVDVTEDVRQEIILAYPMIPLCRVDCKGLCAACGQNFNAGACPHQAVEKEKRS